MASAHNPAASIVFPVPEGPISMMLKPWSSQLSSLSWLILAGPRPLSTVVSYCPRSLFRGRLAAFRLLITSLRILCSDSSLNSRYKKSIYPWFCFSALATVSARLGHPGDLELSAEGFYLFFFFHFGILSYCFEVPPGSCLKGCPGAFILFSVPGFRVQDAAVL